MGEDAGDALDVSIAPLSARPLFDYSESTTPVDVVFLMDNSGSMYDEQGAVATSVQTFVNALEDRGADVALGLTRFGGSRDNNPVVENGGVLTNASDFVTRIWGSNTVGGGHERAYEAVVAAADELSFREGSKRVFIQITDFSSTRGSEAAAAEAAKQVGAVYHGVIDLASYSTSFDDIATATGGALHQLSVDGFSDILTAIGDSGEVGGDLDVSSHEAALVTLGRIDHTIGVINEQVAGLGDAQRRLTNRRDDLDAARTTDEAARSRIEDADLAREQMELARLQMMQQAGLASLAQGNVTSQAVLSLLNT